MPSFRKFFAYNVGLTFTDLFKNYTVREHYNLFASSVNWSRDKIEAYQVDRLRKILKYAYEKTIFYSKRIDECGFNIEKFNYLDQLQQIPPLTRFDIQNNLNDLLSSGINLNKCSKGSSSGSTGHPVIYYHDKYGTSANKASALLSKDLGGYSLGDSLINIWGNPTAVNIEWKKLSSKIKKFFINEIRFPAYRLNDKSQFNILLELIKKNKPRFIYGYTNAIFLLAEFIEQRESKLYFIEGVFTTAENLHDFQTAKIEKHLGKVYDHYGCSEINGIAVQSVYDNYYSVLDPHVFVEYGDVIDKERNVRKLIITDLHNLVMPFVRYENGDMAVPYVNDFEKYKLKFSKIESIDGRVSDIISLPNGGNLVIPSFFGSRMLKNVSGIKQYQIQKLKDEIKVNLIVDGEFKDESRKVIFETLKEYIPDEIKFKLVFNEDIIFSNNGKFKLFIDQTK